MKLLSEIKSNSGRAEYLLIKSLAIFAGAGMLAVVVGIINN